MQNKSSIIRPVILSSKLHPAVERYQQRSSDDRYQIRRTMPNFCKWYRYVSQIVGIFDKGLHREDAQVGDVQVGKISEGDTSRFYTEVLKV